MEKLQRITKDLEQKKKVLEDMGYEVMAIMLQGSQNYELDNESSDIDAKAIVIPSLDSLVKGEKMVSKTIRMEDNSLVDAKDIRLMVKEWQKHNPSYLELLYTKYYVVSPQYKDDFDELRSMADAICEVDKKALFNCMLGMMKQKRKSVTNPTEARKVEVKTYGYDRKDFSHCIRLFQMLMLMAKGEPFKETLVLAPLDKEIVRSAKYAKAPDPISKTVLASMDLYIEAATYAVNHFESKEDNKEQVYADLTAWAERVVRESIVKAVKGE